MQSILNNKIDVDFTYNHILPSELKFQDVAIIGKTDTEILQMQMFAIKAQLSDNINVYASMPTFIRYAKKLHGNDLPDVIILKGDFCDRKLLKIHNILDKYNVKKVLCIIVNVNCTMSCLSLSNKDTTILTYNELDFTIMYNDILNYLK